MRRIFKIAKAELFTLFYSPIAWMIWIVFAFQTGMNFTEHLQEVVRAQDIGFGNAFITANIFSGNLGLFTIVQGYTQNSERSSVSAAAYSRETHHVNSSSKVSVVKSRNCWRDLQTCW